MDYKEVGVETEKPIEDTKKSATETEKYDMEHGGDEVTERSDADNPSFAEKRTNIAERGKAKKRILTGITIVGPIMLFLGFIYWLGGLHPNEWINNNLLQFFPSVGKFLVLPIHVFDSVIAIDLNGKFGIQLIAIAFVLIFLCRQLNDEKTNLLGKSLYRVSKFISGAIVIWHCLMQVIEKKSPFEGLVYYLIIFAVCYAIGRIVERIFKKIKKKKSMN